MRVVFALVHTLTHTGDLPLADGGLLSETLPTHTTFVGVPDANGAGTIWLDQATSIGWHPPQEGVHDWREAKRLCSSLGLSIPTVEDFQQAQDDGISVVDPKGTDGVRYWSASRSSSWSMGKLARAYEGPQGYVVHLLVDDRISVRCIERSG
jgi:hypothetical protein